MSSNLLIIRKYLAHDEMRECHIGDQVLVRECRPLSKKNVGQ